MSEKTPEELADKEINKRLAKAIASRKLEIKRLFAKIKKLEKEIDKIKDGELVPEDSDEESDFSFPKQVTIPIQPIIPWREHDGGYRRWTPRISPGYTVTCKK